MLEFAFSFIFAIVLGVFSGIIPGVTVFVTLLLIYPLLILLDPISVVMIYVVTVSISQFFGSVSATFFGIPGTTTSILSVKEGHTLFKNGNGNNAIMFSAMGSFLGSIFSILLSIIFIFTLFWIYAAFSTYTKATMLLIAVLILVFVGKNSILTNICLIAIGYMLATIGFDAGSGTTFMTFGNSFLYSGLPTISVILSLYIIPFLLSNINSETSSVRFEKMSFDGYIETSRQMYKYKWLVLRSSVIGFLSGFIPGLTFYIGTIVSYYSERFLQTKKGLYKEGNLRCLLAAETSNNAGIFSQILPLLAVGIPITASQAFIYDVFISKGVVLSAVFFQGMFIQLAIAYVLSAVIGLFLAGKYVNWIGFLTKFNFNYIYAVVVLLLIAITFVSGLPFFMQWFNLATLLILLPIGILINNFMKVDCMPLIFAFLMHDHIYSNFLTFYNLIL